MYLAQGQNCAEFADCVQKTNEDGILYYFGLGPNIEDKYSEMYNPDQMGDMVG
jgi:hypothetical protein